MPIRSPTPARAPGPASPAPGLGSGPAGARLWNPPGEPLALRLVTKLGAEEALRRLVGAGEDPREVLGNWDLWARPKQLEPSWSDWLVWLSLAGRGFGKTKLAAEAVNRRAYGGLAKQIALVGATAADVRDVMVAGPAGILACAMKSARPTYEPSKRIVTWPNGATAHTYSGDEPDQLRGPSHDFAWVDELAKFKYPDDAWSNLLLALRLGKRAQVIVTTTPRPIAVLKQLVRDASTALTVGTTYENLVNLTPAFRQEVLRKYEGTRLGRQELNAEILTDTPGALWTLAQLDATRVPFPADTQPKLPDMRRIVVGVDPSGGDGEENDEAGVVAAGLGVDGRGYVLADASCRTSPDGWARRAVNLYRALRADLIVAEANFGGEMVRTIIRTVDADVPVKLVHAARGKMVRAEPVHGLYEQGRVSHVGVFPQMEDELTTFVPGAYKGSPNRLDGLVWALTELMLGTDVYMSTSVV